jgi:RNA polymerase sigma-70 factor (ECF subfamily)
MSLRVPVVLRYYADLSERDIARAIGRRQGTVKSRLHEARRRLADDPSLSALAFMGEDTDAAGTDEHDRGAVAGEEAGS